MRAFAAAMMLLALLAAPWMPQAWAESEPGVQAWRVIQPAQRATPDKPQPQTYRARKRYDRPAPLMIPDDWTLGLVMPPISAPGAAPALAASPATAEAPRLRILVIGDSLGDALASGLEADPGIKADMLVKQKTVSASGLVREDFHDWGKVLPPLLAESPRPDALIVMLGLNDRQVMRQGDQTLEPLSEAWREAYRKRIDALIERAQAARVPLIWVGLPVMRSPKLSTELAIINEMIRDRVGSAGETFVETFDGFSDQSGGFAAMGPDVLGDNVRLRGPDGIHFSPAGQRKLAFFVEKPLRKRLGDRPGAPEPQPAVATLPAPTVAKPGEISLPAIAPIALPAPEIRPRDPIGEVRPLTQPTSANALVGRRAEPLRDPAARDLFDRGLAPAPRPGRADDFRWQ